MQGIDPPDYTAFQAGEEFMKAAMGGRTARVPVYAQMHDFAAQELGIPGEVFYTRPDILVPALLEVEARYKLDIASITYDVYNIEAEGLGQKLLFNESGVPDIDRSQPLIRAPEDLSLIRTPRFESTGRFSRVLELHTIFQRLTGLKPTLSFCAPFSLAANLYGIDRLLVAIYSDPAFVRSLLDRLVEEVLAPWILYQKAQFPGAVKITGADAVASIPVVNFHILEDWIAPGIIRLREICGPEVEVVNWVGESYLKFPEKMLDLKLRVGPGCIQGQDPDAERLGPDFYKKYALSRRTPLILGVGASFLAQSSPTEVTERVRNYVQAGKKEGKFAIYLCNLGATTPPENVRAAVEAVHEYGS